MAIQKEKISSDNANDNLIKVPRLLMVEDSSLVQQFNRAIFRKIACVFDLAEDGFEGIVLFKQHHYDLIYMDFNLPGLMGDETARQMRQLENPKTSGVPIIAVTTSTTQETKNRCRSAGMNGMMPKLRQDTAEQTIAKYIYGESIEIKELIEFNRHA